MTEPSLTERVAALEAFRGEVRLEFEETRRLIARTADELRKEMKELHKELREELREGDEETRRQMRGLHEDVIDRIKTLGENLNGRSGGTKPRRPRR